MTKVSATLALLISGLAVACAIPQRKARIQSVDSQTPSVVTYPTELRGAYVLTPNSNLRFCAEPAPDVALETIQKLTADLKASSSAGNTAEGSLSSEFSTKVIELAGRTQLVLIAREMLYRACELSLNSPTDTATSVKLYNKVAELIERLGKIDQTKADADLAKAAEALKKAGIKIDQVLKEEK